MSITHIETDQLREMSDKEGLIIQGCGGPLQEWVDGINDMLTESGILKNGSRFEDVYSFEHENVTCLLFSFEDVDLHMGKLAMWRLQTHKEFYTSICTWESSPCGDCRHIKSFTVHGSLTMCRTDWAVLLTNHSTQPTSPTVR